MFRDAHNLNAVQSAADVAVVARLLYTLSWGAAFLLVRDIAARQRTLVTNSGPPAVSAAPA